MKPSQIQIHKCKYTNTKNNTNTDSDQTLPLVGLLVDWLAVVRACQPRPPSPTTATSHQCCDHPDHHCLDHHHPLDLLVHLGHLDHHHRDISHGLYHWPQAPTTSVVMIMMVMIIWTIMIILINTITPRVLHL